MQTLLEMGRLLANPAFEIPGSTCGECCSFPRSAHVALPAGDTRYGSAASKALVCCLLT
jgi:hypothetical protein